MPQRMPPTGRALTLAICAVSSFCRNSLAWRPILSGGEGHRARIPNRHRGPSTSSHVIHRRGGASFSTARQQSTSSEEQETPGVTDATAGLDNPLPDLALAGPSEEDAEQGQQQQQKQQPPPWWEEERKTRGRPTLTASTQWRMFLSLKVKQATVHEAESCCRELPTAVRRAVIHSGRVIAGCRTGAPCLQITFHYLYGRMTLLTL